MDSFTQRNFNTSQFSSFTSAIDANCVILTDIPSDIPDSAHSVVVVGYHIDGTLIYLDPEKGCLWESNPNQIQFGSYFTISINSCK